MTERLGDPQAGNGGRDEGQAGDGRGGVWLTFLYDVTTSAGAVVLIGLLIVTVGGVWPPLVAIESGSMEPNVHAGDLVFVMDEERFPGPGDYENTGIVPASEGGVNGYTSFGGPGDVIVFQPGGDPNATPIIHRARFWVEEGEDWYSRANPRHLGTADDCSDLLQCEAPHAGFVTKGDNNNVYDQVGAGRDSMPVKPEWIVGTAQARLPYVGQLRLEARSALEGLLTTETAGSRLRSNATVGATRAAP